MLDRNSLMLKLLSIPMTGLREAVTKLTDHNGKYLAAPLARAAEDLQVQHLRH